MELRDELHNAGVAVQQASRDQFHTVMTRRRELEHRLDALLAECAPILARLRELRDLVTRERRAAQLARLRDAGERYTESATPCEESFNAAFNTLRTLIESAAAVTDAARRADPTSSGRSARASTR